MRVVSQPGRLLACLLLIAPLSGIAAQPQPVRTLEYGEALFYYFQRDYLNAGIRLMAAQERRRLGDHDHDADLLLGGLQLSYGMHDAAYRTFERVLDESVAAAARDRAWYALARLAYRRGYWERAELALDRIAPDTSPEQASQRALLRGLVALARRQPARAVEALQQGRAQAGGDSGPYLDYNQAVALIRAGRVEEGVALLDRLGQDEAVYEETATVRDNANLAGGFALLQSGAPRDAQRFFNRVRLTGPVSNLALLGSGWAATEAGAFRAALTPWRELIQRTPRDAPVLEALIAVPYAYTQLSETARAAQVYEQAVSVYHEERDRLAEAITRLANPDWLLAAGALDRPLSARGDEALDDHWLPRLIASHAFQEAWKTYRDLLQLEQSLLRWQENLATYDTMLATRTARFALVVPRIEARLTGLDPAIRQQRHEALEGELRDIIAAESVWKLASSTESALLEEIEALQARLAALPGSEEQRALAERARSLRGLLDWQVHRAFPERRWEATKAVTGLQEPLTQLHTRIAKLRGARAFADRRVGDLGGRIQSARDRIARQRPRVARALARQLAWVTRLAREELTGRQAQIDSYLLQARYALAQLYDRAQSGQVAQ